MRARDKIGPHFHTGVEGENIGKVAPLPAPELHGEINQRQESEEGVLQRIEQIVAADKAGT